MYVNADTIIATASLLTALGVLAVFFLHRVSLVSEARKAG